MNDELSWYAVRFLLEDLHPDEPGCPQFFEERIVVVKASNEDAACEKAVAHARSEEHEYENAYGKRVQVVFRDLAFTTVPGRSVRVPMFSLRSASA